MDPELLLIGTIIVMMCCCISSISSFFAYNNSSGFGDKGAGDFVKDLTVGGVSGALEGVTQGIVGSVGAIGEAIDSGNQTCKTTYTGKYSAADTVFADPNGKCYKCEENRPNRTIFPVTDDNACEGTEGTIKDYLVKEKTISPGESIAFDVGAGVFFSCPTGTNRNLTSINSETPCTGTCKSLYGEKSFPHGDTCYECEGGGTRTAHPKGSNKECERKCESGYLPDPNGKCYKCGDGWNRTLDPVDSKTACGKGFLNAGGLKKATFGKGWLYSWKDKGSIHQPLKAKIKKAGKAELLGPLKK